MSTKGPPRPEVGVAFLLAQLGIHGAQRFAERIADLDLTPAQAGLLRMIAAAPGQSQQELARHMGIPPSRFVGFIDDLEGRGLVERRRNPEDRRLYALYLTASGGEMMRRIGVAGAQHEKAMCAALDPDERDRLREMLLRIANEQGLTPGVHPGYRHLR